MKPIKRYRIEIGEPQEISVILVGCGGTGSFAALHLARLAFAMKEKGQRLRLGFIDPDRVEPKNIGRQNFCPAEIGQPKAVALARRYGMAFGLDIPAIVGRFRPAMLPYWIDKISNLTVIVGAVDNYAARQAIAEVAISRSHWWLDAGNSEYHGQVLIGNARRVEIDATGYAVTLPRPSEQEPDLIAPIVAAPEPESCAELLVREAQSLMINQMMASWIGVYLTRLLLSRDLDTMATYIDLRSGAVRSVPVTGETGEIAVKPEPRRDAAEGVWDDDELLEIAARVCPECGGNLVEGRDTVDEQEVDIVFCPECNWQLILDDLGELLEAAAMPVML